MSEEDTEPGGLTPRHPHTGSLRSTTVPRKRGRDEPTNVLMPDAPTSLFISASDGLRLHALSRGPRSAPALPVVCLPGLARTAADFDALAEALAGDPPSLRFGGQVSKPAIAEPKQTWLEGD